MTFLSGRLLGQGADGIVVSSVVSDQTVAIKIGLNDNLEREFQIMKALTGHPHIPEAYDFSTTTTVEIEGQ
jgi:hypothetical protein